jgi:putative ABC transport system permease protein
LHRLSLSHDVADDVAPLFKKICLKRSIQASISAILYGSGQNGYFATYVNMASLALRNLFHDKVRLTVTLTGVVFAIVLIVVQLGLFVGFTNTTSTVIDHAGVDLWITGQAMQNFDVGMPISGRGLHQAMATPGVARAEKYIVQFMTWKLPSGAQEGIEVIGFNPDSGFGGPWNLIEGSVKDLKAVDTVIIDDFYRRKLGVRQVGEMVEINDRRVRVVGFTEGIRSFTTSPQVFTWYKNALNYTRLAEDQMVYILIKAAPGVDPQELKRRLAKRMRNVDVYTTAEFARRTQRYWLLTTGAGVTVLIAAFMGLVVGLVVVAQTIYATTMDHLREYGTLKAMGASNGYIYRMIVQQAVVSAVIGYALAMMVSIPVVRMSQRGSALILLPWSLAAAMFAVALMMCIGASIASIRKVTALDPSMVFKG